MKTQFAAYGAAMAEALKAITLLNEMQDEEIAVVNEDFKELHDAYDLMQLEIEQTVEAFQFEWGDAQEVCEKRIAAIKSKYGRMYKKTMQNAGWPPDALTDN